MFVAVLLLDASSLDSFGGFLLAIPAAWFAGGCWLLRALGAAWTARLRLPRGQWLRWLAIPAVLAGTVALALGDLPADLRYAASRSGMDRAAAEVIAGGSTERGWIGLFPVTIVERTENGLRFLVSGRGFIDGSGYAYSTDGLPRVTYDDSGEYVEIGDGWWRWDAPFD